MEPVSTCGVESSVSTCSVVSAVSTCSGESVVSTGDDSMSALLCVSTGNGLTGDSVEALTGCL